MNTDLRSLFIEAIQNLEPGALVEAYLHQNPLNWENITLLAVGKSATQMALAAHSVLGSRIGNDVVVSPKTRSVPHHVPTHWIQSTHPQMSETSVLAGKTLISAARNAKGPCLALISGGGSALAAVPTPGLDWVAKSACIRHVVAAGAPIQDINILRKHLSAIKGGRLADSTTSTMMTLLLSDVVGDTLHSIASGPTLCDPSTYQEALTIVEQRLGTSLPDEVIPAVEHLNRGIRGEVPETPKQLRVDNRHILLAGIGALSEKAIQIARCQHVNPSPIHRALDGTMDQVVAELMPYTTRPGLWIGYGEPTITLPHFGAGYGGRAQHLALTLATKIQKLPVQILVAGSDGIDGNSEAAGAIVDGSSYEKIRLNNIDPFKSLAAFNSTPALSSAGSLITTGPTGVNHADLIMIQVQP